MKTLSLLGGITLALMPFAAIAQTSAIPNPLGEGATFSTIIQRLIDFAILMVPAVSTIMVVVAAFLYMTSGGNEDKVKMAHRTLVWALVGTGIVLLAKGTELVIRDLLGARNSGGPGASRNSGGPFGSPGAGTPGIDDGGNTGDGYLTPPSDDPGGAF